MAGLRHIVIPAFGKSPTNPLPKVGFLSKGQYDVIHAHQLETVVSSLLSVWAKARGIPLVLTDLGGGGKNPMRRLKLYRLVTRFFAISSYSKSLLPRDVQAKTTVIRGGVDQQRFSYHPSPRRPQVLQVGRIMPHKGINYLIEAAGDDIEVVVAGKVVHKAYYERLLGLCKGKRIRFLIEPTDEAIYAEYVHSTATVSASVYRDVYGGFWPSSELLGLTLLESMAVGTPVICSAVGGMPEYVKDGETGFVVAPNKSAELRRMIQVLLDDPGVGERMGRAGHGHVQQYSWENVALQLKGEYESILGQRLDSPIAI